MLARYLTAEYLSSTGQFPKQTYLWNRKGEALEPVVQVWNLSLRPLLEQYLAGLDAIARSAELDRLSKVLLKPAAAE